MLRAFVALALCFVAGGVSAEDLLDQPKELCEYFASLGMKAQFQWGPVPQGEAFLCQYADEFGGTTAYVRAARVSVDPASETVAMGLSIQGFALVRAEAIDTLETYVQATFRAQGRSLPEGLFEAFGDLEEVTRTDGDLAVTVTGPALWEAQRVVGLSWQRTADSSLLSSLGESITPEEVDRRKLVEIQLQERCLASVEASGYTDDLDALEMSSRQLSASRYQFEFTGSEGRFDCQVCDDADPSVNCGTMGLRLSFTAPQGEPLHLPAELDRKCLYALQKEVSQATDGSFIDHELVARITTREIPNDQRYVFEHDLDGGHYRCVIRKRDMSYRLERRGGDGEWRALVGGIML